MMKIEMQSPSSEAIDALERVVDIVIKLKDAGLDANVGIID